MDNITVIVDTREQRPWTFKEFPTIRRTLKTGDYSVMGYADEISIERKSLSDLLMCIGRERARFEREIERLLKFPSKILIVESSFYALQIGNWRSKVHPSAAVGSVMGWQEAGLPIFFANTPTEAAKIAERYIKIAVNRRIRAKKKETSDGQNSLIHING